MFGTAGRGVTIWTLLSADRAAMCTVTFLVAVICGTITE
jgi:hypothetical protein